MTDAVYRLLLTGLLVLLVLTAILSMSIGRYGMPVSDALKILLSRIIPFERSWTSTMENVIFNIRLPRLLGAVCIGGSLALAGTAYQSMFKNPMVSPDLLGVSQGASVGASAALLLGMGQTTVQVWALITGFASVGLATTAPRFLKSTSPTTLVLSGIIIRELMSSLLGIIRFLAAGSSNDTVLASITYWTMGSLTKITMNSLFSVIIPIAVAAVLLLLLRYRLNVLSLGEHEAKSLGVNPVRMQLVVIVCATVLTACSVCISGTVGWVGLIVPHMGRMLVGPDNSRLLPVSCTMGAIFMVIIDMIARNLTGMDLPISIITGIIGAPLFFWLLYKQRMKLR